MKDDYQAYLLRLYRRQARSEWRATLENAQTGEKLHFGSYTELFLFLLQIMNDDSGQPSNQDRPRNLE